MRILDLFQVGFNDVDYQDGKKKNNETDGDWRYRYITTVINSFDPTVRYAEKKWDLSQIPEKFRDEWNCPEITLEIQYQKADGSYQSFSKRAIVVLNGEKDSGVTQDTSKEDCFRHMENTIPGKPSGRGSRNIFRDLPR